MEKLSSLMSDKFPGQVSLLFSTKVTSQETGVV